MTSATELIGKWLSRDRLYAVRRINMNPAPLTEDEEAAVRYWRRREADALPQDDQGVAHDALIQWVPPKARR